MVEVTTQPGMSAQEVRVPAGTSRVLFVDLDGGLIGADLLHDAVLRLAKQSFVRLVRTASRLVYGRAAFRQAVSEAVTPQVQHLPYRKEVLNLIAEQRLLGKKVILVTAADISWARL